LKESAYFPSIECILSSRVSFLPRADFQADPNTRHGHADGL
jgi:hypothetical protein